MFAHYLAVALAKFRRTPFATTANVLTLALGIAGFVAAYGIASWWKLADHYWARAASTYVIGEGFTGLYPAPPTALSSATLARYLPQDIPEIEAVARVQARRPAPAAAGDRKASLAEAVADPAFLEIFDFRFLEGDPSTALADPRGVVLTQSAAERLFGGESALGRPLIVEGDREGVVTGVIAPVRQPSFMGGGVLSFDMLRSWSSLLDPEEHEGDHRWYAQGVYTFVSLPRTMSAESLNARLADLVRQRVPPEPDQAPVFEAFPMTELAARELDRVMFAERPGLSAIAVLLALGSLTLVVACVNYANLATAMALGRAKEVGLRKVLGATRAEIMTQAWLEAMLAVGAALVVAIAALALIAPPVSAATGIDILYVLTTGVAPWGAVLALVPAVGLAAGAYPAVVLSRIRPDEALESGKVRSSAGWMARILVGVQFASASFLLILVTVIQLQRSHLEQTLAADRDPVIVLTELGSARVDHETLAVRLAGVPGVRSVSVADSRPWDGAGNPIALSRGPEPELAAFAPNGYYKGVGYDYFETVGLRLLAGRGFDRSIDTIPTSLFTDDPSRVAPIVVDLTYAQRLGFPSAEAAVDQLVYIPAFSNPRITRPTMTLRIIGVTEPDETHLTAWLAEGNVYVYAPALPFTDRYALVRIARESVESTLAGVTRAWDDLAPTVPASIRFVDDLFQRAYGRYARVGQLFTLVAGAAFVIASLGQLGIATYAAARRRHEIGVRKTLGSTSLRIVRLLLVDFAKPALVANLLAWPLSYLAAEAYLSLFANRVALTPAPFLFSLLITLLIAWLAVTGEVLKAASVRPAEVLRHA